MDFLDFTVFKGERYQKEGILDIRPFSKAIDPHTYIHYSSAHPKGNTRGVVKAEVIRTMRRSSSPEIFAHGLKDLLEWFTKRGYPEKLLKVLAEVKFEDRDERLHTVNRKDLPSCTTVLSMRAHPSITNGEIYDALFNENLPFILLVLRRRPPTTGDLLVQAKTPSLEASHGYHLRNRPPKE